MESRLLKPMLAVYVGLFLLFLYGPFIVLGILSFQKGPEGGPQFPIEEWSLFWYRHILGLAPPSRVSPLPIGISLVRSLTLAFMTMVASTVLGVMAAQAFRRNFRGRSLVFYLIVLGMIVPGVLVGLGSALVATTTGIERHWYTTAFATARRLHAAFLLSGYAGHLQPLRRLGRGSRVVARRLASDRLSARSRSR